MSGQTIICSKKPMNEIAVDVWNQMNETERIKFLLSISPRHAMDVYLATGEYPNRTAIQVSADIYVGGELSVA